MCISPLVPEALVSLLYSLLLRVSRQPMPNRINKKCEYRRDHRDKKDEFRKLLSSPCSLEVFASKPDDGRRDDQRDDIVLNESAGEKSPREFD
jgi:hypothetical protein